MTDIDRVYVLMDKLLTKVSKLLEKRKRPLLTESETAFFDDAQSVALPLIDKLMTKDVSRTGFVS